MPTRLKPCPFCTSRKIKVEHFNGDFHVHCQRCGATGPLADTWAEAEDRWNDRKADGDGKH